jgi:hypothetical protein
MSWKKDIGYFQRTPDMVFDFERRLVGKRTKRVPVIRYRLDEQNWLIIGFCQIFAI